MRSILMNKKYVIVGGMVGGICAASRIRRLDENAEIIVFEKEPIVAFARCGLPYFVGGVIPSVDALVRFPEGLLKGQNIEVRTKSEVRRIFRHRSEVEVHDHATGRTYRQPYDKLILATGAVPTNPDIDGLASNRVFMPSISGAQAMSAYISANDTRRAVVVGGGYIGLEMAENLTRRGIQTVVVEQSGHLLTSFDGDMAQFAVSELEGHGITVMTDESVGAISTEVDGIKVIMKDGQKINTDIVIIASGIQPEVTLAKKAGLGVGITGGIIVDEHMQTTDKDIYAVGDAVELESLFGGKMMIPHAAPASKQGRIAADNICGISSRYKKTLGITILKLFDMTFGCAGMTEEQLCSRGVNYEKIYTRSYAHADYYPGAVRMTIKTMFDPKNGRIFGVQIAGEDGVDKRIDVFATAMRAGLTVDKLSELELAYSPLFGVVKDPVNMAGYVAANVMHGISNIIHWHDVEDIGDVLWLDVRTSQEHCCGTISGAVNMPVDVLRFQMETLPKDRQIVVFCESGYRSYAAERILSQSGFSVKNLCGGYSLYELFKNTKAVKNGHCEV